MWDPVSHITDSSPRPHLRARSYCLRGIRGGGEGVTRPVMGPIPDHDYLRMSTDDCPSPLVLFQDRVTSDAHVRPGRRAASGRARRLTPFGAPTPRRRTA